MVIQKRVCVSLTELPEVTDFFDQNPSISEIPVGSSEAGVKNMPVLTRIAKPGPSRFAGRFKRLTNLEKRVKRY